MRYLALALFAVVSASAAEEAIVVVHKRADSVGIYRTRDGSEVAAVAVGAKPHELILSADGRFAYVTDYGVDSIRDLEPGGSTVSIVDLQAKKKVAEIPLGKYRRPHGIERGASGRLYVTVDFPPAVLAVDPAERRVVRAYEFEDSLPHMLAVSADEKRAWVACSGAGSVVALDLGSGASESIDVGGVPMGIVLGRGETRVFVTNRSGGAVVVLDATAKRVVSGVPLPGEPARLRITPDGQSMIVASMESGEAWVVDMLTMKPRYRVPVGRHPEGIAITPKGRFAYVAAQGDNKVVKISTETWKPVLEIRTAERPDSSAIFQLK